MNDTNFDNNLLNSNPSRRKVWVQMFLYLGPILFALGGSMVAKQIYFMLQNETVVGTVMDVKSANGTCRINNENQPCTTFKAKVEYHTPDGGIFYALIPDHEMPGHNQLESTELYIGRNVDVLYNPENPSAVVSKKEIVFVLLIYLATMSLGALMFLIGKRHSK